MYSHDAMGHRVKLDPDPFAIAAVLFDLDGTLMDTDDQIVENLALQLQRLGWPGLYRSARHLVMMAETPVNGLMTVLDALGLDAPLLGIWTWLRRLRGAVDEPDYRMMTGARAMLADLKQRYQLAVVTTRGQEDAEAFLAQHDLCETFEVVVTRETTWRLKPHPAPIHEAAKRLDVPVERCAMVGDTTMDVKSARRAGATAVAVTCGFGERGELERAGADVILEHVSDLSSVLQPAGPSRA
jgi:phosphoglycolate phosphatase